MPDIELFQQYLFLLNDRMPEVKDAIDSTSSDVMQAEEIIGKVRGVIPKAKDAANKGITTIDSATAFLTKAQDRFNAISPNIKQDLTKVQETTHQVDAFISGLKPLNRDGKQAEAILTMTDDAIGRIGTLQNLLTEMKDINTPIAQQQVSDSIDQLDSLVQNQSAEEAGALNQLKAKLVQLDRLDQQQNQSSNEKLGKAIADLGALQQQLKNIKSTASELKELGSNLPSLEEVQDKSKKVSQQVDAFIDEYNNQIEPGIRTQFNDALDTLQEARDVVVQVQKTIPEIEEVLSNTEAKLAKGKEVLNFAQGEYPTVKKKVGDLAAKIRDFNKKMNLYDLINLLRNDPSAEKGFFAEPVALKENKVYPIANYGTGMTPFYTVLAIWVGGLLMISLLSTDVHHPSRLYTGRQEYFGRALTFLTIGLLQTFVVTTGDMWLLKVGIKEPFWFVLFGLIISLVFVIIVYSLVSVFGNVGKALAIVLLVLQISSSGGTFPVVLLPKFFQAINPFLPFTYGISLMREATGGIYWAKASRDLIVLGLFAVLAIGLGAGLKQPINKYSNQFKEKANKSGLFH